MPRIDFYVIKGQGKEEDLVFACRLAEKAFNQGLKIYIHTESQESAENMDDLLWSFRPESFIPHGIVGLTGGDEDEGELPVLIGFGEKYEGEAALLINLSREIPAFHENFQRIAEIVSADQGIREIRRQHWNTYKSKGYALASHDIS